MSLIQHFCPVCNGVLRVDLIPNEAKTNISSLEVTCKTCGKASAAVVGVSLTEATKVSPSPMTRMRLIDAEHRAGEELKKANLPPPL